MLLECNSLVPPNTEWQLIQILGKHFYANNLSLWLIRCGIKTKTEFVILLMEFKQVQLGNFNMREYENNCFVEIQRRNEYNNEGISWDMNLTNIKYRHWKKLGKNGSSFNPGARNKPFKKKREFVQYKENPNLWQNKEGQSTQRPSEDYNYNKAWSLCLNASLLSESKPFEALVIYTLCTDRQEYLNINDAVDIVTNTDVSPEINIKIDDEIEVNVLIDTGSEVNAMSQSFFVENKSKFKNYEKLLVSGVKILGAIS